MSIDTKLSEGSASLTGPDDELDAMVSKASRPTLASLFEQGKNAGLIKSVAAYGVEATGS
jgi:hypothetical protein